MEIFAKSRNKTYRNIIFDLGAVLMHWNPQATLEKLRQQYPSVPDSLLEIVHSPAWRNLDRGLMTTHEVVEALSDCHDTAHVRTFIKLGLESFAPIPEGLEILEAVQRKGYNTYILSNMCEEFLSTVYHRYTFFKKFNGAVFSYAVRSIKPDLFIYQYLLETYSLRPEESFFIDDMEKNITAAKTLGVEGIVCSNHKCVREHLQALQIL